MYTQEEFELTLRNVALNVVGDQQLEAVIQLRSTTHLTKGTNIMQQHTKF